MGWLGKREMGGSPRLLVQAKGKMEWKGRQDGREGRNMGWKEVRESWVQGQDLILPYCGSPLLPYLSEPQFAQLENGVDAKIYFASSEC